MDEEAIFLEALQKKSSAERDRFLAEACSTDTGLRNAVDLLLRAHEKAGEFLQGRPPELSVTEAPAPSTEKPGAVIGPYKLLEQIGEGGMGTVWMAEQKEPIHRRVAVKVIKAGMDTKQVLARFEAERTALALMDHPNIARVLDAGTTDVGRPYFVMELVKGTPITQYSDDKHLSVRARLELFGDVCRAVQHAHQKGIIHRDLKPSNILIAPFDGKPVVKVIDFGVAKATGQRLTDATLFTGFGAMVGTPEYMSPEQAETNNRDIDTRSDIYSLGVLLYELLTGSTPLTRQRVKEAALLEILRIIREEEAPRPSTRLSSTEELPSISAQRHSEPAQLTRLVRGELDWIVMKALEKDRNRRYETANALALDIQRHLADEPVLASPPSAMYRFRKFSRRNRTVLAMAGVVSVALLLGIVGTTWQAIEATNERKNAVRERDRALSAEEAESDQRREAEARRKEAEEQRESAVAQQRIAQQEELASRRNLYTARITLAEESLEKGRKGYALALLEAERPAANREDLRGFEWYHLWRRCFEGHRVTWRGHNAGVRHVVFSPDGRTLASGSADGTVRLWDVATGQIQITLTGDGASVNCVGFSPGGNTVASGSTDGTIKLWDVATGGERVTVQGPLAAVVALAFSTDGKTLATSFAAKGTDEATTRLWDLSTRTQIASITLRYQMHGPQSLAFFPDGQTLAVGTETKVKLCDAHTGEVRSTLGSDRMGMWSTALSADAKTLATCGSDGVKLFDMESREERKRLQDLGSDALCVAFSSGSKALGVGTNAGNVVLWDPNTGQTRIYAHQAPVRSIAFSPDGTMLASASDDQTVMLWDAGIPTPPDTLQIGPGYLWCAAFTPDGTTAAIVGDSRTVKLWDTVGMQELGNLQGHTSHVIHAEFSPDGKTLATCGDDATIRLWDCSSRQEKALLKGHLGPVYCVRFSPDGRTLASSSADKTVKLWDVSTTRERADLRGHSDWVWAVTFSPDGRILASGADDSTIKLWNTETEREHLTLRGKYGKVRSLAFSQDGDTLFSTDFVTLKTWDVGTGQQRAAVRSIDRLAPLNCVTILPDGKTLAIGSYAALKLWDVGTGRERATLHGHTGQISSVALSPDGRTIATTSFDGSAKFWRTATEEDVLRQSTIRDPQIKEPVNAVERAPHRDKDGGAAAQVRGTDLDTWKQQEKK